MKTKWKLGADGIITMTATGAAINSGQFFHLSGSVFSARHLSKISGLKKLSGQFLKRPPEIRARKRDYVVTQEYTPGKWPESLYGGVVQ